VLQSFPSVLQTAVVFVADDGCGTRCSDVAAGHRRDDFCRAAGGGSSFGLAQQPGRTFFSNNSQQGERQRQQTGKAGHQIISV
jgi:hypothetical protein